MKNKRNGQYDTKRITTCAMLAALGVILLYLGSLIEVIDLSMAVIASLLCVVAVVEYGKGAPWMIYGVTAILSLLLLPNKTPAAMYTLFFGFYPILKEKFERLNGVLAWVLKEIVFNASLIVIGMIIVIFMPDKDNALIRNPIIVGGAVAVCELIFVLYDVAMTRLITFYLLRLRSRFKFK